MNIGHNRTCDSMLGREGSPNRPCSCGYSAFEGEIATLKENSIKLDKYKRMFEAACVALGEVGDALGCDPNEGGSEPLLDAIKELKSSRDESDGVRDILAKHLAGVAIALKGPELALHRHGYHDLEEKAQVAMLEIELLKHKVKEITGARDAMTDEVKEAFIRAAINLHMDNFPTTFRNAAVEVAHDVIVSMQMHYGIGAKP